MANEEVKKKKEPIKVKLRAAWEWFKSAAWLQVILIVAIVIGVVVAIPFVVRAISDAANKDESKFYKNHRKSYADVEKMIAGENSKGANGYIGNYQMDEKTHKIDYSQGEDGFVLLVYKTNCDNCNSMQKPLETWWNTFEKEQGKGKIKLYTLDVSWVVDDATETQNKEGKRAEYKNKYVSLAQQKELQEQVRKLYNNLDYEEYYKSSEVTDDTLKKDLDGETDGGTFPTPCFITYSKDRASTNYVTDGDWDKKAEGVMNYVTPKKVIFGNIDKLSISSAKDIATQMNDIYCLTKYKPQYK